MENEVPAVSVLMSVWNGLPYVAETIDSIVNQTCADWEFIINDNASTDGTAAYLVERATSEPRIKVLLSEENLGVGGGYNNALSAARAPWVAIIDADDRALPHRLERQLQFVRTQPDVKVVSCLAYYINADGSRVAKTHHDLTTPEAFERYRATNEAIGILCPGALIERTIMLEMSGFRQDFFPAEDIDLWARISERGMILVQPEYLMEYRVHGRSSVTQAFQLSRMKYEWSRACSTARRLGAPEPSWEEFLADWRSQPLLVRLDRWRKITAKGLYRKAGFDWISHRRPVALGRAVLACLLQPHYAIGRFRQQVLGSVETSAIV